jgi:hypothetical protein
LIQQIPKQNEFLSNVMRNEKQGYRYRQVFLDLAGPLWTKYRKLFLSSFRSAQKNPILQNNAYDLLSWLDHVASQGGDDGKAANALLSETDFVTQIWNACVAAPLNPRAIGSLRNVRTRLISCGSGCKTPSWWVRVEKDLPPLK